MTSGATPTIEPLTYAGLVLCAVLLGALALFLPARAVLHRNLADEMTSGQWAATGDIRIAAPRPVPPPARGWSACPMPKQRTPVVTTLRRPEPDRTRAGANSLQNQIVGCRRVRARPRLARLAHSIHWSVRDASPPRRRAAGRRQNCVNAAHGRGGQRPAVGFRAVCSPSPRATM
jgi:hypothetical protein